MRAAGKIYKREAAANDCLNPRVGYGYGRGAQVPEAIQPFTNTDAGRPMVGEIRTHWGKSADEKVENSMIHGVQTVSSVKVKDLINPEMANLFDDVKLADAESIYKSKRMAPLGKVPAPIAPVPRRLICGGFGKPTERSGNAGTTVNPPKKAETVYEEDREGHDLYKKTHNDYFVGEQIDRNYMGNWNHSNTVFGVETPHENDGRRVCQTLKWPNPDIGESSDRFGSTKWASRTGATKLVSGRVDWFRERTQPQLGKVHDPIKSTVGVTEAFGLSLRGDGCGAGDIIHGRKNENFLLGKDRQRGVLAAVRHHLKKANYHNFNSLREAFSHYDKNNNNAIDINELRRVCFEFNLPIDDETLASLMAMTTQKGNSKINYLEFVNLLNWKDKMPKDSELDDIEGEVVTQIDKSLQDQITSSSSINATVGGLNTKTWPSFGVPTVRSDIPAPNIRRVSDRTNYGDELDAHGLLSPSIYTTRGVFESDFFEPRDKLTIKALFTKIGVNMDDESWEKCWSQGLEYQQQFYDKNKRFVPANDKVSVECFRMVLDRVTSQAVSH